VSRLIDIGTEPVTRLAVRTGDVISFAASGARVEGDADAVEPLGAFLPAVVTVAGDVLSPETPPTTVLLRASAPGRARIVLVSPGDLASPAERVVEIEVGD
jgi:hypothetical protein